MKRLGRPLGHLDTDGNPWKFPPAAVVIKGLEGVRKFYTTWEQCDCSQEEVHALKLVFVGAYGAGKTSLARSIKKGRGDRTPETDEHRRTTVGVDLHNHRLSNGTECKIYDVAGQITYYGLHQFFLTERAIYVLVWDATRFEGLSQQALDQAIEFLELHEDWKSLRQRGNSSMDSRMTIVSGVLPVGCKLESESKSYTSEDGLQAVEEKLSEQESVASLIPPSWVAARQVLEQVGNAHDGSGSGRQWELRSILHDKFKNFVQEGRSNVSQGSHNEHPAAWCSSLQDDGVHDSMEGAIELRAFSGTVISHNAFVVLDVMWLAGVLKPILDHRGATKNRNLQPVFADRVLNSESIDLLSQAEDLVDKGILWRAFARFLWKLDGRDTGDLNDPPKMDQRKFEEILEEIGVAIPLPVSTKAFAEENDGGNAPATGVIRTLEDGVVDGKDLLVIMRLPEEATPKMRETLSSVREPAVSSGGISDENTRVKAVKAVFEFDHAGAPHGLPERVMALAHQIGTFHPEARWRHGGLFILNSGGDGHAASMIVEYDRTRRTFSIEALGQTTPYFRAVQFLISALFHVARDFPGAAWTGWMECRMNHPGQKIYHLAPSNDKQSQKSGSWIIPRTDRSPVDEGRKQRNRCRREGVERGSCTVDPDEFGRVLNVKQPSPSQGIAGTEAVDDPSPEESKCSLCRGTEAVDDPSPEESKSSLCREVLDYVLKPLSGKIFSSSLAFAVGFFVAATAVDDSKRVTLNVCFGLAGLCFLVAVIAAVVFVMEKITEGRKRTQEEARRADPEDDGSFIP
eukprot:g10207.t1